MLTLLTSFLVAIPGAVVGAATCWEARALRGMCNALLVSSLAHHGTRPRRIEWILRVDQAMCYATAAMCLAICALSGYHPFHAETLPCWLSLIAAWGVSGPVSENPRYYERGWHRLHGAMHCTAAAGLTAFARVLRARCDEEVLCGSNLK